MSVTNKFVVRWLNASTKDFVALEVFSPMNFKAFGILTLSLYKFVTQSKMEVLNAIVKRVFTVMVTSV